MYQKTIIEKTMPVVWPDGETKIKVFFEVPLPSSNGDRQAKANINNLLEQVYQPLVDRITSYLANAHNMGIDGGYSLAMLAQAIDAATHQTSHFIQERQKTQEKYR